MAITGLARGTKPGLRRDRRNGWIAAGLASAITIGAGAAAAGAGEPRFCSYTALLQLWACRNEVRDDYYTARAGCVNVSDSDERRECGDEARTDLRDGQALCTDQRAARLELCAAVGEERYEPEFDSALFDDPRNPMNPNPYYPLAVGYEWEYEAEDESNTVVVLDKTKLIEGVTCIVINDLVEKEEGGGEDTDDWYALRKDGTVDYCGESVRDFEMFPGDDPQEPELVETEGSFKTGRDGELPGTIMLAAPTVGTTYRQEYAYGNAEDAATVVSSDFGPGSDPQYHAFVPEGFAEHFCSANDCLVTLEVTPIEPDISDLKYYAYGLGLFLEVKPGDGEINRLVDCNLPDARCEDVPQP